MELLESGNGFLFYVEGSGGDLILHLFDGNLADPVPDYLTLLDENRLSEDDWSGSFYEGVPGVEVNDYLYVRYDLSHVPDRDYTYIIDIDPVMSFGDGNHATTSMCLELLHDYIADMGKESISRIKMVDVGTGTGILTIMARKMGVREIDLFDIDEESCKRSGENLIRNGITDLVPAVSDIFVHVFKTKYNIVMANLLTAVIEKGVDNLLSALDDGGVMILSGIGADWTDDMKLLFEKNSLHIVCHRKLDGWNGFMVKKAK